MKAVAIGALILSSLPMPGQKAAVASGPDAGKTPDAKRTREAQDAALVERGQFAFEHNCNRCHTPPQGFSPRISETVAMHMRVRANLSQQDFKALMRFLNP